MKTMSILIIHFLSNTRRHLAVGFQAKSGRSSKPGFSPEILVEINLGLVGLILSHFSPIKDIENPVFALPFYSPTKYRCHLDVNHVIFSANFCLMGSTNNPEITVIF